MSTLLYDSVVLIHIQVTPHQVLNLQFYVYVFFQLIQRLKVEQYLQIGVFPKNSSIRFASLGPSIQMTYGLNC